MFTYNKKMRPYGLESSKKISKKKKSDVPTLFWDPMESETEVFFGGPNG